MFFLKKKMGPLCIFGGGIGLLFGNVGCVRFIWVLFYLFSYFLADVCPIALESQRTQEIRNLLPIPVFVPELPLGNKGSLFGVA